MKLDRWTPSKIYFFSSRDLPRKRSVKNSARLQHYHDYQGLPLRHRIHHRVPLVDSVDYSWPERELYPLHRFNRHLLDLREQIYSIEMAIMGMIGGRSVSAIALQSSVPSLFVSYLYLSQNSDCVALRVDHKVEGRMCQ